METQKKASYTTTKVVETLLFKQKKLFSITCHNGGRGNVYSYEGQCVHKM